MKKILLILILSLPIAFSLDFSLVINSTSDQKHWDVIVPNINYTLNQTFPLFLAIDKISINNSDLNFILVCGSKNPLNSSCKLIAKFENQKIFDGCSKKRVINDFIICRGRIKTSEQDIILIGVGKYGNKENRLIFKLPGKKERKGIIAIFNLPTLKNVSNFSSIPYYFPLINGSRLKEDYSKFDWILTNIKGVKDFYGNEIKKYPLSLKSFLKKEGILVFYDFEATKKTLVSLYNSKNQRIDSKPFYDEFSNLKNWVGNGKYGIGNSYLTIVSGKIESKNSFDFGRLELKLKANLELKKGQYFGIVCKNGNLTFYNWECLAFYKNSKKTCSLNFKPTEWNVFWIEWNSTHSKFGVNNDSCLFDIKKLENCKITFYTKEPLSLTIDWVKFYQVYDKSGKILWIDDKHGNYTLKIEIDNQEKEHKIFVENNPEIKYFEMKMPEIIANKLLEFKRKVEIFSNSVYRKQPINLNPNTSFEKCLVDGSKCYETIILEPSSKITKIFKIYKKPIIAKLIKEVQNSKKVSSVENQWIIGFVNVSNQDDQEYKKIKGAVLVDGTCENWMKDWEEVYWIPEKLRKRACYFYLDKLKQKEWKVVKISYYGDWIDVEFSNITQDLNKNSTLEKQYFVKFVKIKLRKNVEWKDVLINVSMKGKCLNCFENVTLSLPIIWFTFDKQKIKGEKIFDELNNEGRIYGKPKIVKGFKKDALYFEKDYIKLKDVIPTTNSSLTWIVRFKLLEKPKTSWHYILNFRGCNGGIVQMKNGYVGVEFRDSKCKYFFKTLITPKEVELNKWYTVAVTWDNKTKLLKGYVNGELVFSVRRGDHYNWGVAGIGSWTEKKGFFKGVIDEVLIFDKALSENEVKFFSNFFNLNERIFEINSCFDVLKERINILEREQKIIFNVSIKNEFEKPLFNISGFIPYNLTNVEKISSNKKLFDLKFDENGIYFKIPEIRKHESFLIEVLIKKPEKNQTKIEKIEKKERITGLTILKEFVKNYANEYVIVFNLICISLISYLWHRRK